MDEESRFIRLLFSVQERNCMQGIAEQVIL